MIWNRKHRQRTENREYDEEYDEEYFDEYDEEEFCDDEEAYDAKYDEECSENDNETYNEEYGEKEIGKYAGEWSNEDAAEDIGEDIVESPEPFLEKYVADEEAEEDQNPGYSSKQPGVSVPNGGKYAENAVDSPVSGNHSAESGYTREYVESLIERPERKKHIFGKNAQDKPGRDEDVNRNRYKGGETDSDRFGRQNSAEAVNRNRYEGDQASPNWSGSQDSAADLNRDRYEGGETSPNQDRNSKGDEERKQEQNKKKRRSPIRKVIKGLLIALLVLVIAAAGYVGVLIARAPDVDSVNIAPDCYLSVIEDVNGEKTQSLYSTESNRIYVPLNATPEYLQHAFVAIEDSRFYTHHGVDLKGVARAFLKGIANGGHFTEGASTITQQLLKNNVFDGWMNESGLISKINRKIQEQYLALRVEAKYSKDWILENYMNTINLGGGTRGVQTAAQYYFGKDVSELTLAESALIAGITKNPTAYNPKENPEASLERQHLVLDAMEKQGYITAEDKQSALEEDVIGSLVYDHSENSTVLSWFEDALLESVVSDLMDQKGMTEDEAWDLIYNGGLTICSTQNSALQAICEEAVNREDFVQDTEQISVVVTDVNTGAVAAIVGGRGEKDSSLVYNRATDAVCQPGSTIKIIGEYAAALDQGLTTLGSVLEDEPYTYSDGTEIHNANETYGGKTTVRQAISTSCNVIALKMLQNTGIETTAEYLQKFGITTLTADDYQESLAIGGTYNGVTNLELTGAYNAIAAGGKYVRPYYYTKVTDHDGNTILENDAAGTQAVSSGTASLLTLGMEEVINSGTGMEAACDGMELAGKSGTTNDFRDVWFVGFSSSYTCGVWGGHDDNTPQEGSGYVKAIWKTIMEQTPSVTTENSNASLVDTSTLTKKTICTKCGKLATSGLCDQTVQGDMTAVEYYVPGTEPTTYCDCHERITLCKDSSLRAGKYCPSSSKYDSIFLKEAVPGTADEAFTADWLSDDTCTVHKTRSSLWSQLWGNSNSSGNSSNNNSGNNSSGNTNGNNSGNGSTNGNNSGNGSTNGNNNSGNNNSEYNNSGYDSDENQDAEDSDSGTQSSGGNSGSWWNNLFGW